MRRKHHSYRRSRKGVTYDHANQTAPNHYGKSTPVHTSIVAKTGAMHSPLLAVGALIKRRKEASTPPLTATCLASAARYTGVLDSGVLAPAYRTMFPGLQGRVGTQLCPDSHLTRITSAFHSHRHQLLFLAKPDLGRGKKDLTVSRLADAIQVIVERRGEGIISTA